MWCDAELVMCATTLLVVDGMTGPAETPLLPDELAEPTELTEAPGLPDALTEPTEADELPDVACGSAETEPLADDPLTDAMLDVR